MQLGLDYQPSTINGHIGTIISSIGISKQMFLITNTHKWVSWFILVIHTQSIRYTQSIVFFPTTIIYGLKLITHNIMWEVHCTSIHEVRQHGYSSQQMIYWCVIEKLSNRITPTYPILDHLPTLIIVMISVGSRKLLWPTTLGLFSVFFCRFPEP